MNMNVSMKIKKRKISKLAPLTVRNYIKTLIDDLQEENGKYCAIACDQGQAVINTTEILTICVNPDQEELCIMFKNKQTLVLTGIDLRKNVNGSSRKT